MRQALKVHAKKDGRQKLKRFFRSPGTSFSREDEKEEEEPTTIKGPFVLVILKISMAINKQTQGEQERLQEEKTCIIYYAFNLARGWRPGAGSFGSWIAR